MTIDTGILNAMSESHQMTSTVTSELRAIKLRERLEKSRGMKKFMAARTLDEQHEAYEALPQKLKDLMKEVQDARRDADDLPFHLYAISKFPRVKEEMAPVVDQFIDAHFQRPIQVSYHGWQNMLFMSTFGGQMTDKRPDVWHLAYEFNAIGANNRKVAVPWNPIEMLYEHGLLKVYGEKSEGNNLTFKGQAILTRMTERFGAPRIQSTLKLVA
ncbi:MAG TPA: hypothetical protein VIN59_01895 [Alphaproteobacteria bacterium]